MFTLAFACDTAPETAEKVARRSLCQGVFEPQDLSRLLTQFKSNFIPLSAWVTTASSPWHDTTESVGLMVRWWPAFGNLPATAGVLAIRPSRVRGGAAAFSSIDFASRGVPSLIAEREMSGESGC
jgi:hypothetical protein